MKIFIENSRFPLTAQFEFLLAQNGFSPTSSKDPGPICGRFQSMPENLFFEECFVNFFLFRNSEIFSHDFDILDDYFFRRPTQNRTFPNFAVSENNYFSQKSDVFGKLFLILLL